MCLVARGFSQHPGYDYTETFLPVVWMDTLWAILALASIKNLKIKQMDVKGAYLNGKLHEIIYMMQPEGFEDGTDRVCRLIKPLYGLKQAGREWNNELDDKLKKHGYMRLQADPCAYAHFDNTDMGILTVWVDDTLLFTMSDTMMQHMENTLKSEWEVTALREPTKIVRIEITQTNKGIKISGEIY